MTPPPEETLRPQAALPPRPSLPDAWRIEVFRKDDRPDPDGSELLEAAAELGILGLRSARLGRGVLLSPHLSAEEIERVRAELLCDPVLDVGRVTAPGKRPTTRANAHRALVARKPGVMDPVANTVARVIKDAGLLVESAERDLHVTTFRAWELEGEVNSEALHELGTRILANETIEDLRIDEEGLHFAAPSASSETGRVEVRLRNLDDEALMALSRSGQLSLDVFEMRAVQSHFVELDREPSLAELETIAQTWSEHCKHKTFTGRIDCSDDMGGARIENLLKETIKRATLELDKPWCVSVFHDNAGIVEFDQGWDVCFKVETQTTRARSIPTAARAPASAA